MLFRGMRKFSKANFPALILNGSTRHKNTAVALRLSPAYSTASFTFESSKVDRLTQGFRFNN
jgi:hypothetical protein